MPKRAQPEDTIDPVRSRLAAAAAAPVAIQERPAPPPAPAKVEQEEEPEDRGQWGGRAPVERSPRKTRPQVRPGALTVNRKIMVTAQEAQRIEETTAVITGAFGSKVTYSQVSRALWSILAGSEEEIRAGARRAPKLQVPSKGDHIGMAEYEEALADFLLTALKRS